MIVVADAGGTKTDWFVSTDNQDVAREKNFFLQTGGINPSLMTEDQMSCELQFLRKQLNEVYPDLNSLQIQLYFHAAGCNSDHTKQTLTKVFKESGFNCHGAYFSSDLEGAARAVLGSQSGVACILGTGSASGFYNGKNITESIPSLGYVLGDEGSGAFMGKLLLNKFFKNELSAETRRLLADCASMSLPEIIYNVYRSSAPNKYLASFVPFLKKYEELEDISQLIDDSLKLFFEKNVLKYGCTEKLMRIGFVGGVAKAFEDRVANLSNHYNFTIVNIEDRPIRLMAKFYKS